MKELPSLLRWVVAFPLALLAAGLAASALYTAFWLAASSGAPFMSLFGVVGAPALGAHVFVTVSARVAPAARLGVASAACGLVFVVGAFWWYRLPLPAAYPVVLPLLLGALAGVAATGHAEHASRPNAIAEADPERSPQDTPPQS